MLQLSQWLSALRYSQSGIRIGTFGLAKSPLGAEHGAERARRMCDFNRSMFIYPKPDRQIMA